MTEQSVSGTFDNGRLTVAVPKEIVPGERRVALIPDAVARLTKDNDYVTPVLLHPGSYVMTVLRGDGQVLLRREFEVQRYRGLRFPLPKLLQATTAPAQ